MFDIYTIIFLALAVFIFLRLRSVLGQRTGRERPPFNPFAARESRPGPVADKPVSDKVVALPTRATEAAAAAKPAEEKPAVDRWKDVAAAGSVVAEGLDAIHAADPDFDPKHFITGARGAYEMIVTAYAEGDRKTLKNLLARDVYDGFDSVIRERETRGEVAETRFVSIDATDLIAAEQRDRTAQLTVRFVSKLVSTTRDKAGAVIDGSAEKVTDVTDVWTFARDTTSRDPNWKLVATETGR